MAEAFPGHWQPWEPDGSGRHKCGSGKGIAKTSSPRTQTVVSKKQEPETYATPCPWQCGASVYYHTNGYGDCVYFDDLGYPWKIHPCWDRYWKTQKARQQVLSRLLSPNSLDQQKLRILTGALRQTVKTRVGKQQVYAINETKLAQQLGISVERFREAYSHLYQAQHEGIKLSSSVHELNTGSSNILSKLVNCKQCGKVVWQRRLIEHLKKAHPFSTVACRHCHKEVSVQSLEKHLVECKLNKSNQKKKNSKSRSSKKFFRR